MTRTIVPEIAAETEKEVEIRDRGLLPRSGTLLQANLYKLNYCKVLQVCTKVEYFNKVRFCVQSKQHY